MSFRFTNCYGDVAFSGDITSAPGRAKKNNEFVKWQHFHYKCILYVLTAEHAESTFSVFRAKVNFNIHINEMYSRVRMFFIFVTDNNSILTKNTMCFTEPGPVAPCPDKVFVCHPVRLTSPALPFQGGVDVQQDGNVVCVRYKGESVRINQSYFSKLVSNISSCHCLHSLWFLHERSFTPMSSRCLCSSSFIASVVQMTQGQKSSCLVYGVSCEDIRYLQKTHIHIYSYLKK